MASPEFPQEIIDSVLEELHGDIRALRRCSYVSRAFLPASRRQLFAKIRVASAGQCERLYTLLSSRPDIVPLIRQLHVIHSGWVHGGRPTTFSRLVRLFTDYGVLEKFHFQDRSFAVFGRRSRFPTGSGMEDLFRSPRLTDITLYGLPPYSLPIGALIGTPSLSHLSLTGIYWNPAYDGPIPHRNLVSPLPAYLRSLDVRGNYSDCLLQYLWECLPLLRTLRMSIKVSTSPASPRNATPNNLVHLRFLQFDFKWNLSQLPDVLALPCLPHSIRYLVLVIASPDLRRLYGSGADDSLTAIATPSDAYPHPQAVYMVVTVHPGCSSHQHYPPEIAELELHFPQLRRTGLLRSFFGNHQEVEAVLEDLGRSFQ